MTTKAKRGWGEVNGADSTKDEGAPAPKKVPAGVASPVFSNIDISRLTIDAKPGGDGEVKHAFIKYGGERLGFQLSDPSSTLRAPFGIDDGSKFGSKPSLDVTMPDAQLAFFKDKIEATVKDAAIKHKETWFAALKPVPSDEDVRNAFSSRVREDETGKYEPRLRVNIGLGAGGKAPVRVMTARRLPSGKVTKPVPGAPEDVTRGCRVVPVLRTAGGVWVNVNAKKKTFEYGLVFEASDLLVVNEDEETSAFNVEVASSDGEAEGEETKAEGEGE